MAASADWKKYILSPSSALVEPKRVAIVPWDPKKLDSAVIEWRSPNELEDLPIGEDQGLLFDFGVKTTGLLYLESPNATNFGVHIQSGPDIRLCIFEDTVKYSSGAGCFLEERFRALRFLKVRSAGGTGIKLRARVKFTAYSGEYKGHFFCNDEMLNKIWYTGAYTIQLCTQPHQFSGTYNHLLPSRYGDFPANWRSPYGEYVIWDGPRRDREVWIGDMWPESHGLLYSFHAPEAVKNSLYVVTGRQNKNGSIPGSGITLQPFAEYSCWWIALLDSYYLLTGDREFLEVVYPNVQRATDWLLRELESNNGFLHINHRQTWAWTLMRRGVVTGSQAVAVAALEGSARILSILGDSDRVAKAEKAAMKLRELITSKLWNSELGVFRDCLDPVDKVTRISCDSNALPSLFSIATPEQTEKSFGYLQSNLWTPYGTRTIVPPEPEENWNWAHNHNIWPFVVGLELEARFVQQKNESAMVLMRACWGNMIEKGANCFWEMVSGEDGDFVTHRPVADIQGPSWDSWDSYSHGWSAAPTYLMPAYILGIRALEPGFSKFRVNPWLGELDYAEGSIPTPHGPIHIKVEERSGKAPRIELEVPEGTEAVVEMESADPKSYTSGRHQID